MNEQLQILKLVAERLDHAGIAYMISGSIAASFYAEPRFTRDIDLVAELQGEHVETLISLFEEDFYIDEQAVREAIVQQGMFSVIHLDSTVKVDFIVRKETPYRLEEFGRKVEKETEGVKLWFVTAEDLLLSKLVWSSKNRSELQMRDIKNIIAAIASLDWNYIEHWAAELLVENLLREIRA